MFNSLAFNKEVSQVSPPLSLKPYLAGGKLVVCFKNVVKEMNLGLLRKKFKLWSEWVLNPPYADFKVYSLSPLSQAASTV